MKISPNIISKKNTCVEWSAVNFPIKGEKVTGDDYLVISHNNQVLVSAVDALGHGEEAKKVSQKALKSLKSFKNESLIYLVNHCHAELRGTRGVVMSMAVFDCSEDSMAWIGVGNVEGILFRAQGDKNKIEENILLRGGVVGYKLPPLKASIVSVLPGDILIFTTDGVSYRYSDQININRSTEEIVQFIASNYVDFSDDSQILVARYTGG
ncbi:MAG: SpoIIE family protein phosphatase [Balneolaceae bacterium]